MTNFIFKSQWTFKKISNLLELVLAEQRLQRSDLATLLRLSNMIQNNLNINNQAKDYYQERLDEDIKHIPEDSQDLD